ncbi:MAG: hypothetical protein HQL81_05160 [Magnetococcales bacterium]|nr:hypothetical protein [Magnetococcales bacterium]
MSDPIEGIEISDLLGNTSFLGYGSTGKPESRLSKPNTRFSNSQRFGRECGGQKGAGQGLRFTLPNVADLSRNKIRERVKAVGLNISDLVRKEKTQEPLTE